MSCWGDYGPLLCLPNTRGVCVCVWGGGGILFLVQIPLAPVASCLHSISWTMGGFWPNLHNTLMGRGKEVIRFWWPWPHFQGHTSTLKCSNFDQKILRMSLVCTISPEPKWCILTKLAQEHHWDMGKKWVLVTLISFSRSHQHFEYQILTKKACLYLICWTKWLILAKLYVL